MYTSYTQTKKADLVQLKKELKVAISDKERVRIHQIASRLKAQKGIPEHIAEEFRHRKAEIRKLTREIERAKGFKVEYKSYRQIIGKFNLALIEAILKGYIFTIPKSLGKLSIKKIKRKGSNPIVDWGASNKVKKETGEWNLVYFLTDWWFRWYWEKKSCTIRNKSVYSFKPTRDGRFRRGAADKLCKLVTNDPFAHLKFEKAI